MNDSTNTQIPMSSDPKVIDNWENDLIDKIMPKIISRLEVILPDYICDQVLKHINYPMDFVQAAQVLCMKEDTLRKWDKRGLVSFVKKDGRYLITLRELCKQIGHSVVLQKIRNQH